ncbi:hypothetical protein Rsub_12665 [Raphidocelis subcapitata]|uniref:Peptidase M20 dimerisation domain-containing protein n=1 Tax=Raphidocelis subcapitata TaxID=307507 RepID=A0A2V0PLN6_9CHLO|nr:hypothetical protein Rsub_12665 [Raphidocelis subcapitata]|eukprot:GBF99972.1 hypothetical protein Rsub_12665 [Raphidocelis subcapitata]
MPASETDAGRVEIELVTAAASPPTKVTPTDGHYFTALKAVIQEVWRCGDKPLPVLPFLLPGLTDSRHYERLSANGALKWLPTAMSRAHDLRRVHGTDERSSLLNLRGAMCTAARVMQALCGAEGAAAAGGGGGQHSEL